MAHYCLCLLVPLHQIAAQDRTCVTQYCRLPDALVSGAAQTAPPEGHEVQLQDLQQQLNYKNAEATNLRTNLVAVQSELAAVKIATARGAASSSEGRQGSEALRLQREIQQLRTKLEFAEQARREMQRAPAAGQAPQCRTTAAQTDVTEQLRTHDFSSARRLPCLTDPFHFTA